MCFTLLWVFELIAQLIFIVAVIIIARILIPWLLALIGVALGPIPQIINIIIGVVIALMVLWFVYDLIVCVSGVRLGHFQ